MERTPTGFDVRRLEPADAGAAVELCRGNPLFYAYHPPEATEQSILEDMAALPPGKTLADKYFLGFWRGDLLAAVMDLVLAYPDGECAYIGFFMMNRALQGKGLGSAIIGACLSRLKAAGFHRAELAIDQGNPQSKAFWEKNGFLRKGTTIGTYIPMVRQL